ncbi:hypothetical protein HK405_013053, partial [Cladochytrium tenue]
MAGGVGGAADAATDSRGVHHQLHIHAPATAGRHLLVTGANFLRRHLLACFCIVAALLLLLNAASSSLVLLLDPSTGTAHRPSSRHTGDAAPPSRAAKPRPRLAFRVDRNASTYQLLSVCHLGGGSPPNRSNPAMITRSFAAWGPGLEDLYLDTCFPIEISTSQGGRSVGHCSDFVQYIYHAGARLSPNFTAAVYEEKLRRCPDSVYLHGEYPIDVLYFGTNQTRRAARNYWMPNLEQIKLEQALLVNLTHTFLAKTRITAKAIADYMQVNKVTGPSVQFMYHSTPDPAPQLARMEIQMDYNKLFHSYGHSGRKHTRQLIECWLEHPEFPHLTIVGHTPPEDIVKEHRDTLLRLADAHPDRNYTTDRFPPNLAVSSMLAPDDFLAIAGARGVHLCPSVMEGYGHYINVARALGALPVTTAHPPMSEFVTDATDGVLIRGTAQAGSNRAEGYQLIRDPVFVAPYGLSPDDICAAVQRVVDMPVASRAELGHAARARYDTDTSEMAARHGALLVEAVGSVAGGAAA